MRLTEVAALSFLLVIIMQEMQEIVENSENYEQLKQSTKTFLQVVTSNDLHYALFLFIVLIVLLKVVDLCFSPFKRKGSMLASFLKNCIKIFLVGTIGMRICSLIPIVSDFTSQIVLSSSLIVVVLGFVFQEGLANIVHGFILSVFRPFKIGDRIRITVDGEQITGYVREIGARHTVIQNVLNSSHVIIPNSKMDLCVIDNNYYDGNLFSSSFLDLAVTYDSDIERAIEIMAEETGAHPHVQFARMERHIEEPVSVMVRELGESAVYLRVPVVTKTVEENFAACSDLRRSLISRINDEPSVRFAYPHVVVAREKTDDQE